jgi:hypothetical protein
LSTPLSLAGQLDPRLLDSRELRLFVEAVVPLSERPRLLLRKIEEPTPGCGRMVLSIITAI